MYCLLFAVRCAVCCLLRAVCWLWFVVCLMLRVVRRVMCVCGLSVFVYVCCVLFDEGCPLRIACCSLVAARCCLFVL